jgi:pyruvate dehydrogenase E2 component (dihydrolipoamide acetyltransferase)
MAEFRMPSLGADMEAGRLVEWRVARGDAVRRGQVIAVVETDKGAIEIEIWDDGTVEELAVQPGEKVPVGTVLARVRGAGVPAPQAPAPAAAEAPRPGAPERVLASPAARARARELGLDLASVRGTGPGGAVTLGDVEGFSAGAPVTPAPRPGVPAAAGPPAARPVAAMRQAIGAAMARSKREIPHYYLGTEIDLSLALAWLARENERRPVAERLLPAAVLLWAVARAAREVPEVNGFFVDGAFRPAGPVHLGVAISLRQGGLVAPAIHGADAKGPGQIMKDLNDLVLRARRGGLRSSELSDPTLTVTSLGDLGAASVYGVIYPPQVALVGFGRIQERPWAAGGQVEVRPLVHATLSGDHRASDGIRGAQFLAALERFLRAPEGP